MRNSRLFSLLSWLGGRESPTCYGLKRPVIGFLFAVIAIVPPGSAFSQVNCPTGCHSNIAYYCYDGTMTYAADACSYKWAFTFSPTSVPGYYSCTAALCHVYRLFKDNTLIAQTSSAASSFTFYSDITDDAPHSYQMVITTGYVTGATGQCGFGSAVLTDRSNVVTLGAYCFVNKQFTNSSSTVTSLPPLTKVSNTIETQGLYTVPSGNEVNFQAGTRIIIGNGFVAANGSSFFARIMSCIAGTAQCPNTRIESEELPLAIEESLNMPSETNRIYPNPSNGIFKLEMNGKSIKSLRLFDIAGNAIENAGISTSLYDPSSVSVSNVPNGTYHLKVETENKTIMVKVTILK